MRAGSDGTAWSSTAAGGRHRARHQPVRRMVVAVGVGSASGACRSVGRVLLLHSKDLLPMHNLHLFKLLRMICRLLRRREHRAVQRLFKFLTSSSGILL